MSEIAVTATLILFLKWGFAGWQLVLPAADMGHCVRMAQAWMPPAQGSRILVEAACIDHASGGVRILKPDVIGSP